MIEPEKSTAACSACGAALDGDGTACFLCGHARRSPPLKKGQVIADRYELLGVLGRGGMGTVYEAHDRSLDERVALKVLSETAQGSADADRRFRSEIRLARKIRHPNVCAIHEYGELQDVQYIVMEFVDGQDLKKYLRSRGMLTPDEAIDIARQVGEGLQAIHDAGVIHRDLKLANVMRDSHGRLRLMDFGIAKGMCDTVATATGQILGTPEYMSPEQVQGQAVDARADIYSLGVITYELLTGRVPFKADTPLGTIMLHVNEPPRLDDPAIPPALVPVLKKALAKKPEARYDSARAFVRALALPADRGWNDGRGEPTLAGADRTATIVVPRASVAPGILLGGLGLLIVIAILSAVPWGGAVRPASPVSETWNALPVYGEANVEKSPLLIASGKERPEIGRAASVTLSWIVTPEGLVDDPKVVESASKEIDSLVVAWIQKGRYEPGQKNGKAVPVRVQRKYAFGPRTSNVSMAEPTITAEALRATPSALPTSTRSGSRRETKPATAPSLVLPSPSQPQSSLSQPPPTPTQASMPVGYLQLGALPYAQVFVDGKEVGTLPLRQLELTAGNHVVRFLHPDYQPLQRTVTIRSGETKKLFVDFSLDGIAK